MEQVNCMEKSVEEGIHISPHHFIPCGRSLATSIQILGAGRVGVAEVKQPLQDALPLF